MNKSKVSPLDENRFPIALFCVECAKEGQEYVANYVVDGKSVCGEHCQLPLDVM